MKYRIVAMAVLALALLGAALLMGDGRPATSNTPAIHPSSPDEGAMKGFKIE